MPSAHQASMGGEDRRDGRDMQDNHNDMIARIDERMKMMIAQMEDIKKLIESNYVTKQEFGPVKSVVYGIVGVVLMAVITAIAAAVMK